ncbi:MAG: TetR/AcrR family transcriptional regulator [Novosphingobium sp.]|nr:TetR/AcrR family transcriptional regulator [Novosphingobium sp.]
MISSPATTGATAGAAVKDRRRSRDPGATREVILDAALTLLAKSGPDALSLSEVAHLAGVNRGTAYQHFETREKLIQATVACVSDKLYRAAFGDPATAAERRLEDIDPAVQAEHIAGFAIENPELCRIWLLQLLDSDDPKADPFCREYMKWLAQWASTDLAEPNIDVEVHAITMLAGTFLWPVWARAHDHDAAGRAALARRFARENLRLSMYGTMRSACYPEIAARVTQPIDSADCQSRLAGE